MKKLYEEFFAIPKEGNIREKVILSHLILAVIVIVICLSGMGLSAYAYFSHGLTSGQNTVQAASFELNITIQNADPDLAPVKIEQTDSKTHIATLLPGNTYQVTLEKKGTAATGFCAISVVGGEAQAYHTQQLGKDVKSDAVSKDAITFTLTVTNTAKIAFHARWGTSVYYADYVNSGENDAQYILDGETVILG